MNLTPNLPKGVKAVFYLLSMTTGILECGFIVSGAVRGLELWQILFYPLCYHLGNLFPKPFFLPKKVLLLFCSFSLTEAAFLFVFPVLESVRFIVTCLCLFLLSAVIQSVRDSMKSDGNRLLKRVFRVAGFALSPLAVFIPEIILCFASAAAFLGLTKYSGSRFRFELPSFQGGYSIVMLFHQLHYFFYAHITLAAACIALSKAPPVFGALKYAFVRDPALFGAVLGALFFCGTWITYMSAEPAVSRLTKKTMPVFFAGHTAVFVLLLSMSFVTDRALFIVLWLLTGFGGGTVYTITAKAKQSGRYDKYSMTVSENAGHALGLLAAVIVSAVFGTYSPDIMLVCGSVSALAAMLCMTVTAGKEKKHENIPYNG